MELKEITIEQLMANRYDLQKEYEAIKAYLLQKINRMEEIEKTVLLIDNELITRSQKTN